MKSSSSLSHSLVSSSATVETTKSAIMKPPILSCRSLQVEADPLSDGTAESILSMASGNGSISDENSRRVSPPPKLNVSPETTATSRPTNLNSTLKRNPLAPTSQLITFRNRTNLPSFSPNILLQTIIRDKMQIADEYQRYKTAAHAKILKQEDTIRNLKENIEQQKRKMLEIKLQNEVYVAREAHAFQEIQKGIQNLLEKVSAQVNSFKLETLLPDSTVLQQSQASVIGESSLNICFDEIVKTLKSLEDKMTTIEGRCHVQPTCTVSTEESVKSYMNGIHEKLDQIMLHVMENRGCYSSQSASRGDTDVSLCASVEDNQDSDNGCDSPMAATTASLENVNELELKAETESSVISLAKPIEIEFQSGQTPSPSSPRHALVTKRQKRKSSFNMKHPRNRCQKRRKRHVKSEFQNKQYGENNSENDSEKPPTLSLPCRIAKAKHSFSSPESMPLLQPEGARSVEKRKREQIRTLHQEIRKDDALIGIKKENFSNILHGKDFSKAGFVCLCGAKFTGAGGLYVHQVKTMENEKFSCRSCGKKFHYFSGLKAHRKSAHKQEFTQEVGCSRCGQVFKSKRDRQGHLDGRGQTCWLSGSYQSKDWEAIRNKRNLSSHSSFSSSSASSSQNANSQGHIHAISQ